MSLKFDYSFNVTLTPMPVGGERTTPREICIDSALECFSILGALAATVALVGSQPNSDRGSTHDALAAILGGVMAAIADEGYSFVCQFEEALGGRTEGGEQGGVSTDEADTTGKLDRRTRVNWLVERGEGESETAYVFRAFDVWNWDVKMEWKERFGHVNFKKFDRDDWPRILSQLLLMTTYHTATRLQQTVLTKDN